MSECGGDASEGPRELSQEEIWAEFDASLAEQRREQERIKADALAAGKEPFDLHRFFDFYIMDSKPSEARWESASVNWERDYFSVRGRRFMTVEAFAKYLNEIDVYGH